MIVREVLIEECVRSNIEFRGHSFGNGVHSSLTLGVKQALGGSGGVSVSVSEPWTGLG